MSQFFQQPPNAPYGASSAQNLQFYPSSYTPNPVSGHATPSQAAYGYGAPGGSPAYGNTGGFNSGFGAPQGVSGRMGEQGGLRTGWLAAFGTEGYDGEPPLLEELGVNFAHIQSKVCLISYYVSFDVVVQKVRKLTCEYKDLSSSQPSSTNRSTYNGRLRPRRPYPLFPCFRNLPPLLRKGTLWIYLRPSTSRQRLFTPHPLTYVSSSGRPFLRSITKFSTGILTSFFYSYVPKKRIGAWVLFVAIGVDEFGGSGITDGWYAGIYPDEFGNCVVYV